MTDIPNPPFRDMPPLSHIESKDSRFTPLWEQWFLTNRSQVNGNTKTIATHTTQIAALQTLFQSIFHVGCLFETTNSANPSTYFGFGTWALYGTGRTTVCIDSADADFDTVGETGGSKSASVSDHTHSLSSHVHALTDHEHTIDHTHGSGTDIEAGNDIASSYAGNSGSAGSGDTGVADPDVTGSGGNATVDTLSPYIVVYRWRRTA